MIVPNHTTEDGGRSDHAVDRLLHCDCSNFESCIRPQTSIRLLRLLCSFCTHYLSSGWSSGPWSRDRVLSFAGCHRFPDLGNSHGADALALSVNSVENWLEQKAGVEPYQGGFLLHYMDKLVYPDISATALTVAGVLVCAFNLAVYGRRACRFRPHNQRRT